MTDEVNKGYRHIFGPVPSRRLGMSLGIELVPHKTCTFNCIYCECGRTTLLTADRSEYVDFRTVQQELTDYFRNNPAPDYLTFSGAGEPTLNSCIGDVMAFVKKQFPGVPVALLTNGSLLFREDVRKDILDADLLMPSLDAAMRDPYIRVNRPHKDLSLEQYIHGLVEMRKVFSREIWLEVFILPGYNDDRENLDALKTAILRIKPDRVQLNTLDRPGTVRGLKSAGKEQLQSIIDYWGLQHVETIAAPGTRSGMESYKGDIEQLIYNTISRRPCTLDDLVSITGAHINVLNKYLGAMEENGRIGIRRQDRGDFYYVRP